MAILIPSDEETVRMGFAVARRVAKLAKKHAEVRRKPLNPPQDVRKWMRQVVEMRNRHNRGDYSHTSEELMSLGRLAEWMVRTWHDLHGTAAPATASYFRP